MIINVMKKDERLSHRMRGYDDGQGACACGY